MNQSRKCRFVFALAVLITIAAVGTYGALWVVPGRAQPVSLSQSEDHNLLARVVAAEAEGEPLIGQVAVASVILNRVRHPSFPNSMSGVIFQPHAFESVSNGLIWRRSPSTAAFTAARQALSGWDPTYGAVFFWNPSKPVSPWIWSRSIIVQIGQHVFAR
jgi:N-acetylmuramoyl-L-alanine amidase